jgi:hypothetical protein
VAKQRRSASCSHLRLNGVRWQRPLTLTSSVIDASVGVRTLHRGCLPDFCQRYGDSWTTDSTLVRCRH